MTARRHRRARTLPALFAFFCAGLILGWLIRDKGPPLPVSTAASHNPDRAVATIGGPAISRAPVAPAFKVSHLSPESSGAVEALNHRDLRLPIDGTIVETWKGSFGERRDGRQHDAVDIQAARNTAIHAVDDGTIAKLFDSKAGGHTIYQFDPTERFCYYYAHLERYAEGLADGKAVRRGDVIGYVGTSGNAPPGTPHLHFTIFELTDQPRWWQGRAIDPYLAFKH